MIAVNMWWRVSRRGMPLFGPAANNSGANWHLASRVRCESCPDAVCGGEIWLHWVHRATGSGLRPVSRPDKAALPRPRNTQRELRHPSPPVT